MWHGPDCHQARARRSPGARVRLAKSPRPVSVNSTAGETLATYRTLDEAGNEAWLVKAADAFRRYRLTPFAERARIPTRAANILEGSGKPSAENGPGDRAHATRSATEFGQPGAGRPYWSHPCMVKPPDTLMTCPVMKLASSLARKATMPGMSSGWPRRFRGMARLRPS
jgi:hypothetical protein